MGVIASVYCTDTTAKVIFVKKGRKGFTFKDNLTLQPGEYRSSEVYLSYSYPDLVFETVRIPPVSDEETIEILVKKRLSDTAGLKGNYLVVFQEVPEESTSNEKTLRVFAIPEEIYKNENVLPKDIEENLMIFTTPHFSIHGVSKAVAGDMTVLHAFADDEILVMTVSGGDEVLYTRSLRIPPYTKTDEQAYIDLVYENLNMTYMFVARRSNISVDFILLSGKLYDKDVLVENLISSVDCGIATPTVPKVIKNTGPIIFLEFLPCFGNLLLDRTYDFSPQDVKERRSLRIYLSKLVAILTIISLLSVSFLAFEVYKIERKLQEIFDLRREITSSLPKLFRDTALKREDIEYYTNYLNLIWRSRKENPLGILPELENLLKAFKAKEYRFSYINSKAVLSLTFEKSFTSLAELSIYRERLLKALENLKKKGFNYRIELERKYIESKTLLIKVTLEKEV